MESPPRTRHSNQFTNFRSPARRTLGAGFPSPPSSPTPTTPRKRRNLGGDSAPRRVSKSPAHPEANRMNWKSESYTSIMYFFNKAVPEIVVEDRAKTSVRDPAPFDLHLDKSLILKTVKHSSLIVSDLLEIAMDSLQRRESERGLPLETSGLSYASLLAEVIPPSSISAQADLANHYAANIAGDCSLIAAALLLRLPTWTSAKLLEYSRDTSGQTHSKADGFLRLRLGQLPSTGLTYEDQGLLKGTERTFPRLATWLFKRLGNGEKEQRIMRQILKFSNDVEFPWTSCEGDECNHLSSSGTVHVTGAPRGRDADEPTIRLDEMWWSDDGDHGQEEEAQAGEVKNAKYILQQAWAQSVANDTTFLIIKSANYEIIGHRDRENQTLLLSDLIHVPNFHEGYMQLQIGLFMSVLEDAFCRYELGKALPTRPVKYDVPAVRAVNVRKPKSERERADNWRIVKTALLGYDKLAFHVRVSPGRKPDFPKYLMQTTYNRISEPANNRCGTLHLALELRPDDNICAGRISAGRVADFVTCKIAHGREEAERLSREYQAYQSLACRGIPCLGVYGLFHSKSGDHAVMLLEHANQVADTLSYQNRFIALLDQIHSHGFVLGRLTESSLLCTDYGYACFVSLSCLRKANNTIEQENEKGALCAVFNHPSQRPRISHAVSVGPFVGYCLEGEGPINRFNLLIKEMLITSPRPIRISEGQVPDMIDVEFEDKEARDIFFEKWCSARKPAEFGKLGCTVRL